MDSLRYQKILTDGFSVDLSSRAKCQLSGADRVRYLNGQVTNDVRSASPERTLYACDTNAKGKIEGDIFVHADPNGAWLVLDAEPECRDPLGMRLEKYIIADDVELGDISDSWRLWHIFGHLMPGAWQSEAAEAGGHALASDRFGAEGLDVWLPAESQQTLAVESMIQAARPLLNEAEIEMLRILRHIPRFPQELNADAFPAEAGLEARAMSFTKGCYIGQEVLSRIKTTGRMPRQLVAWEAAVGTEVSPGDELFDGQGQRAPKALGTITSMTRHPEREALIGLAYVRQGLAAPDSVLLVGKAVPRIAASVKLTSLRNHEP